MKTERKGKEEKDRGKREGEKRRIQLKKGKRGTNIEAKFSE